MPAVELRSRRERTQICNSGVITSVVDMYAVSVGAQRRDFGPRVKSEVSTVISFIVWSYFLNQKRL